MANHIDVKYLNKNENNRAFYWGFKSTVSVLSENICVKIAIHLYIDFTNKHPDNNLIFSAFETVEQAKNCLLEGFTYDETVIL